MQGKDSGCNLGDSGMQGTEFVWMQGTAFRVKSGGFRGGIRECRERDSGSNLWVSGYAGEFVKHLLGFREFRGFRGFKGFRVYRGSKGRHANEGTSGGRDDRCALEAVRL